MTWLESSVRTLDQIVAEAQREQRVPGLLGAVARDGQLEWCRGVGVSDVDGGHEPDADTQYGIGSITKMFTAVMVMALRDEGRLDLDDRLDVHLPVTAHGDLTLRRMLSHVSGLQREPDGNVWESLKLPDVEELYEGLPRAESVLAPRTEVHYSNLAFSLLGQVVATLDGRTWIESLQTRVLDPLGLTRTTNGPSDRAVVGYQVDPYSDHAYAEPVAELASTGSAGSLWSTATDLATFSKFLSEGADGVLAKKTLDEMCYPQAMSDLVEWRVGFGLGVMLLRTDQGIRVGHTGGMPGLVTGLVVDRTSARAGIALLNTNAALDPGAFAVRLLTRAAELEPVTPPPWRPGPKPEPRLAAMLGRWYSEGAAFTFAVRDGRLEARADDAPPGRPPAVFAEVEPDFYRTVSGREKGERLLVTRDEEGGVSRMHWATYALTREPLAFGELVT